MPEKIVVTSALPYANGPIHFGHVVGAYLPADVWVRYRRMRGDDVHFVCGTDEHGVAITLKAEQAGARYEDYVDQWHEVIGETLRGFHIDFDTFSGTAHHRNPHHRALAQQFFLDLHANGYLNKRTEEQFYSEASGRFLPDRYIEGTCYLCGFEDARGDECPNCGKYLDAKQLKSPRSSLDGSTPILVASEHWYFDLGRARDEWLREWFESKRSSWKPNVANFVASDLDDLRERPITRDLPWGVPVPLPDTDGKALYVWFDAPIGYLSISKQYLEQRGEPERFEALWKDPSTKLYHFIGKDNITFHTIVFPAILRGADRGWILPENVPANEFFNYEGRKFNTSAGWYIPHEVVAGFDPDVLRYALCTMMPETADTEWRWQEFQSRVNDDLADNLGNFVTRTLRFIENAKFFGGTVPALGELLPPDHELFQAARERVDSFCENLDRFRFRQACQDLMAFSSLANGYYESQQPWKTIKADDGRARAGTILRICTEMIRALATLATPIMPGTARTMLDAIGVDGTPRLDEIGTPSLPDGELRGLPLTERFPRFVGTDRRTGAQIEKRALIERIPDEFVAEQLAGLRELDEEPAEEKIEHEPLAESVEFDAFAAVDLRAGTVAQAEKHAKADRLLVLSVDLGFETRTIVAGIAGSYDPEELVGSRVVVVANLAPRKLRGIESQGMLLAADDHAGRPRLVRPADDTPNGTRIH